MAKLAPMSVLAPGALLVAALLGTGPALAQAYDYLMTRVEGAKRLDPAARAEAAFALCLVGVGNFEETTKIALSNGWADIAPPSSDYHHLETVNWPQVSHLLTVMLSTLRGKNYCSVSMDTLTTEAAQDILTRILDGIGMAFTVETAPGNCRKVTVGGGMEIHIQPPYPETVCQPGKPGFDLAFVFS